MGNLIADDTRSRQFTYNAMGRMAEVRQGASVLRRYAYNAWGEQVSKTDGTEAGTTLTLYDEAGHWLGDYDHAGHATQQAIWLDDHPIGLMQASHTYYLETDHLGTPRVAIDPARDVAVWRWDVKGETFGSTAPDEDPDQDGVALVLDMRFPGQRYDAVTGLYYNYQRDYDHLIGRYVQSDPIGLTGGINTYAYVGGNPLSHSDPNGLRVTATYDHATGNVYIADDSTGAFYTLPAGSGGNPWGDPIPNGDYDILEHPDPDFFRLEPVDGRYGDDTHAGTGRDKFRLHKPGRTIGCIAADENSSWSKARDMIRATKTDTVEVRSKSRNPFAPRTESLIRYGRVTVVNSPR